MKILLVLSQVYAPVGAIESFFKQYMLLRSGEIPRQRLIGFASFEEDEEEEYGEEDVNDDAIEPQAEKKGGKN